MIAKKKKTTKTKTKHNAMWQAAFNSAITGLTMAATQDMSFGNGDVETTEESASIVRRAEKIADIAAERLS